MCLCVVFPPQLTPIQCLGSLHTKFAFLPTIGNHMAGFGLKEAWIESGIIDPGAADAVLKGKSIKGRCEFTKLLYKHCGA